MIFQPAKIDVVLVVHTMGIKQFNSLHINQREAEKRIRAHVLYGLKFNSSGDFSRVYYAMENEDLAAVIRAWHEATQGYELFHLETLPLTIG